MFKEGDKLYYIKSFKCGIGCSAKAGIIYTIEYISYKIYTYYYISFNGNTEQLLFISFEIDEYFKSIPKRRKRIIEEII